MNWIKYLALCLPLTLVLVGCTPKESAQTTEEATETTTEAPAPEATGTESAEAPKADAPKTEEAAPAAADKVEEKKAQ